MDEYSKALRAVLKGGRIKDVRFMSDGEMKEQGWYGTPATVLIIENKGVTWEATVSQDEEGNGPGALFLDEVKPLGKR